MILRSYEDNMVYKMMEIYSHITPVTDKLFPAARYHLMCIKMELI